MKYPENVMDIARLRPDYLGFIFYDKSPRNFDGVIPPISSKIKKTGVFVDADISFIIDKIKKYNFNAIQLHGNETAEYCIELKKELNTITSVTDQISTTVNEVSIDVDYIEIFKVFGIKDTFDFSTLEPYEGNVDYFLFDTKGQGKGGNGYTFDWTVLKDYKSTTPFILSGGIGPKSLDKIEQLLKTDLPIYALDLNSKFEVEPALKSSKKLEKFFTELKEN